MKDSSVFVETEMEPMRRELEPDQWCWLCGMPWLFHGLFVACGGMQVTPHVYALGRFAPEEPHE